MATVPNSTAESEESDPTKEPRGVLAAPTMYTSAPKGNGKKEKKTKGPIVCSEHRRH